MPRGWYCNLQAARDDMHDRTAITFRLPHAEADRLAAFAAENGRTQTEILREHIRTLKPRLARPAKGKRTVAS
jgi:hypothetical protein